MGITLRKTSMTVSSKKLLLYLCIYYCIYSTISFFCCWPKLSYLVYADCSPTKSQILWQNWTVPQSERGERVNAINTETTNSTQAHCSKGYQVIVTEHSAENESWHIHSLDENSHSSIANIRGIDAHIFQYDRKEANRSEKSLDVRMANIAAIIR